MRVSVVIPSRDESVGLWADPTWKSQMGSILQVRKITSPQLRSMTPFAAYCARSCALAYFKELRIEFRASFRHTRANFGLKFRYRKPLLRTLFVNDRAPTLFRLAARNFG
jgi:hypothetical protein